MPAGSDVSANARLMTRSLLVVSIAVTVPFLLFGSASLSVVISAMVTALVYATALLLTVIRPGFGVRFSGGVAIVSIVPLAVVAFYGTEIGLIGGGLRAGASIAIILGLPILLQTGLLISAVVAAHGAEARPAGWLAGGAAGLAAVVAIHAVTLRKEPARFPTMAEQQREKAIREDTARLDATWMVVSRCPSEYAAEHPSRGYPQRLDEMADCVPPEVASGTYHHAFSYFAGPADRSGAVRRYILCADVSGHVMTRDDRGALLAGGGDCRHLSARWVDAHSIRSCLVYYAALHPAEGYPRRLAQIGPEGTRCLVPRPVLSEKYVFDADKLRLGDFVRFEYTPIDADERGIIRGFSIVDRSGTKAVIHNEATDQPLHSVEPVPPAAAIYNRVRSR